MKDPTEEARRALQGRLNHEAVGLADPRTELEAKYGQLWDTDELREHFAVCGFAAPFVVVTRKSDGVKGSLLFSHNPKFYHSWTPA